MKQLDDSLQDVSTGVSQIDPAAVVRDRVEQNTTNTAIGLVARPDNTEVLAWGTLWAQNQGHAVFLTYTSACDEEVLEFADGLGATVVDPESDETDPELLRQQLVAAAHEDGYEHVFVNRDIMSSNHVGDGELRQDGHVDTGEATTPECLVAIPAYNEAGTIGDVVGDCQAVADEVLVIDDGSDDETAVRAESAGATVVEHAQNQGYGAALQTAFEEADVRKADHLVIIDADGQHDPADIPQLIEAQQESGAELAIGSRFTGDGDTDAPLYRRLGLGVVNALTNLSMGVIRPRSRVRDTQSGFRAYDRTAIESLAVSDEIGDRMSASTDILYHAQHNDFDIEEVGTTITYEVEDASSHNPLDHGLTLVKNILFTIERKRPMTVLGVPGFASALTGIGFSYWTLSNFLNSGTFPVGLALVSSVFMLGGVFACFTGIILHALNTQVVHRLEET
ncbi:MULTISPECIES: glycosyltransferase family 2 protein [Halomicrobium]|uniref:Glycosyl transferase family 2 n=2 Tax=Halomicrobium mukohataei TaxID=57705 RepID=C7NW86_HALMD|nr:MULTISPECIES: glycosyltransferase family 2 protein [Halomicrobium]ACV46227.1 glycosyl transferase family 2 [Halomicrobium mukohataei DSM 12286]